MLLQAYTEELTQYTRLPLGVEARSCGHLAHIACFEAYVQSLKVAGQGGCDTLSGLLAE